MSCLLVNENCFLKGASSMLSKDNQIYQFENMTIQLKYLDWMKTYELCLQNAASAPLCDFNFGSMMKVNY